ncbi:MAG: hypothetical protein Q8N53_24210 [Longimicrobiales bacterium]|nr:hypothetical protein [Longimicrobiales bacterium]
MRARSYGARPPRGLQTAALTVVLTLLPGGASAQDVGGSADDAPLWTRSWSPLRWIADLPRILPSASGALPEPLLWPAPRVGLFWTAGNPAGLPADVSDELSVFRGITSAEDGTYRRPLDPARVAVQGLAAAGWRPFGDGAAVGSVRVTRSTLEGALSDYDLPYPGSPYVVMDTAASDLGRTEATLAGAAGWRSGPWSVGVALGYRAQQSRTEAAPVPRVLSSADPGASVGLAWGRSPALRVGVHGRWRAHAERVLLYSVAASSRIYRLQGYFEARPQDVASGYYQRRMERDGLAGSLELGGETGTLTWTGFVERGALEERQHPTGDNDPASDIWAADAWTFGGAARLGENGGRTGASASIRYTSVSGEASRGDLPDTVTFVGDESVLDAWVQATGRLNERVRVLALVTLRSEGRARTDQLARVGSDLQGWTTGLGAGVELRASERLELGGSAALATYGGGGGIPDPSLMGPAFRRYVAPELILAASDATATEASLSLLWKGLPRGAVWARARYHNLKGSEGAVTVSGGPQGDRDRWTVDVGVVLGR